jgi:hypothetical protein
MQYVSIDSNICIYLEYINIRKSTCLRYPNVYFSSIETNDK